MESVHCVPHAGERAGCGLARPQGRGAAAGHGSQPPSPSRASQRARNRNQRGVVSGWSPQGGRKAGLSSEGAGRAQPGRPRRLHSLASRTGLPRWPMPSPPFPEPSAPPKGTSPSPPGRSGRAASRVLPTPQQADSRRALQQEVLPGVRSPAGSSHLQEPITWVFRIVLSIFSRLLN